MGICTRPGPDSCLLILYWDLPHKSFRRPRSFFPRCESRRPARQERGRRSRPGLGESRRPLKTGGGQTRYRGGLSAGGPSGGGGGSLSIS